mmetsp:Transcript_48778/g.77717  ORF Transcript_48778/g.77717 Transcript_48778/m.77717 type:complete len:200 (+) Transcript_48778:770-1369(+)
MVATLLAIPVSITRSLSTIICNMTCRCGCTGGNSTSHLHHLHHHHLHHWIIHVATTTTTATTPRVVPSCAAVASFSITTRGCTNRTSATFAAVLWASPSGRERCTSASAPRISNWRARSISVVGGLSTRFFWHKRSCPEWLRRTKCGVAHEDALFEVGTTSTKWIAICEGCPVHPSILEESGIISRLLCKLFRFRGSLL